MTLPRTSFRAAALLSAGLLMGSLQAAPPASNTNWWDKHGDDESVVEDNRAPLIDGLPPTEIIVGDTYSFTPTATDADGDRLRFSITNRPVWAGFDRKTGALTGIPAESDLGSTTGIVIQVTDGSETGSLPSFDLIVRAATSDDGAGSEPVNSAPEISGTPATEVMENAEYRFTPTASDPDGDELLFSIENRPIWAQFDDQTGALSGTPNYSQVGTTAGIVISVTDGVLTTALQAFDISVLDDGIGNGTVELSWTPPTTRTDGSMLTDLGGYRIHYGQVPGAYSEMVEIDSGITSHVVEQLEEGQWYFAMTALDSQGMESDFSAEVGKFIGY